VRAEALASDLGDAAARDALAAEIDALGLTIEVLVNNAGFGTAGRFTELDREREVEMVRLNCEAVVDLCGRYAPPMAQRGRGAILNVASTAAFQPLPRQTTYAGTKAFVLSFTESLHQDMRAGGVAVTALCPGPVRTEFVEIAGVEDAAEGAPSFVWESAEDVAEAGVRGLERNRRVVVPGLFNRATAMGGQHAPRGIFLRLADRFYPIARE
jgi:uncharacterized protein